ncbi:C-type lectin lectoxin-Phi1-like [Erythrolamprus reginae]|uniref:C-type lectin lectoxin-Phi1-like n=1 Tax=Erythrolamprus reginae TaxID=121349 RepID=UPI00396CEE5C
MFLITCFIFGLLGSLTWAGSQGRTICPPGTFAHKERSEWNCYKLYEEWSTFEEAEQECQFKWHGHLASINSYKEAKSLAAYVTKQNMESFYVWIGLQREERSNINTGWRWVDGNRSKYRKWGETEPNDRAGQEYCASLDSLYGFVSWADLPCNWKLSFLCKWKSR